MDLETKTAKMTNATPTFFMNSIGVSRPSTQASTCTQQGQLKFLIMIVGIYKD
jgi:hypothetical protein